MYIECFEVVKCWVEMVLYGNMVYIGGQVVDDFSGDIQDQICQILENIDWLFQSVGSDCGQVFLVCILLVYWEDYVGFNQVWDQWFFEGWVLICVCSLVELIDLCWWVEMIVVVVCLQ